MITEMKNTREGINSRITKADKWPGRQNDGNHSTEQNMENNAEMKTASEASGATVNAPTSH